MSKINQEIINKIINNINIVDEVGKDIQLQKKGANYVGLCPFHNDNNPSFFVNPDKKICHCFVCNEGGNVITYRQKYNKISFNEAVSLLAKELGITINTTNSYKKPMQYLLEDVANFYHQSLELTTGGKNALNYLLKRGMSLEIINKHCLGFADEQLALKDYLIENSRESKKYSGLDINNAGIFNKFGKDFFANRLTIPIKDEFGNIVGFSSRRIKEDNSAKYQNSPMTKEFNKSKLLYNFDQARYNLVDNFLILVEGFFDVYSFELQGFYNVAATMGTAVTNEHINLLKKYKIKKIILSFDQDLPGIKTNIETAKRLLMEKIFDVKIINFDHYKDIDEYVQAGNDVKVLVDNAITLEDYAALHNQKIEAIFPNNNVEINQQELPKLDYYEDNNYDYDNYYEPQLTQKQNNKFNVPKIFSDEYIILKYALKRDIYYKLEENNLLNNIKDLDLKIVLSEIKKLYASNASLNNITFSILEDNVDRQYHQILENLANVDVDEKQLDQLIENNNPQANLQLSNLINRR